MSHVSLIAMRGGMLRGMLVVLALAAGGAAAVPHAKAHDIPDAIAATGFVTASAERTDILLRLPLILLADFDLPKTGPGYLDLAHLGPVLRLAAGAAARAVAFHDGAKPPGHGPLAHAIAGARISLPGDRAFQDFARALALIHGPPLPPDERVFYNQGFFDVHLTYPAAAEPVIRLNLAPALGDRLHLGLRYLAADGTARAYALSGGRGEFPLDPRWHQAAWRFAGGGARHIVTGIDHLLFLLCLVVPFRRQLGQLIGVVTAFTAGHSLTLAAAALGWVALGRWFPPVVEVLIAASILYLAVENVLWPRLARRWLIAAGFGLVHGFAFAQGLAETLQFAGAHLALALAAFNLGIEIGQVVALLLAIPVLNCLFRVEALRRHGTLLISILVGHEAWHWLVARAGQIDVADWRLGEVLGEVLGEALGEWAGALDALAWAMTAAFAAALMWLAATRLMRYRSGVGEK